MARRSKDEAEETRENIIDAAVRLFLRDGVSKTTLEKIACEAGYTRGAVYHHFENKATLLYELHRLVKPPAEQLFFQVCSSGGADPLSAMRDGFEETISKMLADKRKGDIHAIFLHNCEFVDQMNPIVESECHFQSEIKTLITAYMIKAQEMGQMRTDIPAGDAAAALHCFGYGLISLMFRNRLTGREYPMESIHSAMDIFFKGLRPVAANPTETLTTPRES